jgi:Domain of unknown function (DUF4345)
MRVKRAFLVLAFAMASVIALLYGISPTWFARTFMGVTELSSDLAHIFRAMMCLYLALACFWLFAAFGDSHHDRILRRTRHGPVDELPDRWPTLSSFDLLCCN